MRRPSYLRPSYEHHQWYMGVLHHILPGFLLLQELAGQWSRLPSFQQLRTWRHQSQYSNARVVGVIYRGRNRGTTHWKPLFIGFSMTCSGALVWRIHRIVLLVSLLCVIQGSGWSLTLWYFLQWRGSIRFVNLFCAMRLRKNGWLVATSSISSSNDDSDSVSDSQLLIFFSDVSFCNNESNGVRTVVTEPN